MFSPLRWIRRLLTSPRLIPCEKAGFPPFSNEEIGAHTVGLGMPQSLWHPLWKEITTPPPEPELSRPVAGLPCIWWRSLTGGCKHGKYRPKVCRASKKEYIRLHPEDDRWSG